MKNTLSNLGFSRFQKFGLATISANAAVAFVSALPVHAQSSDWASPATTMLDSVESGLLGIAGPIVGIGIIAYGVWALATGRIDFSRLIHFLGAGLLVFVGPTALRLLLSVSS